MINTNQFAEMANQANFTEMSYRELLDTKNACLWGIEHRIDPLLETKRHEELVSLSAFYLDSIRIFNATRAEIISCLEEASVRENVMFTPSQDVDDQTPTVDMDDNQDKGKSVLALPEHIQTTSEEVIETLPTERPAEKAITKSADVVSDVKIEPQKLVKKAIKMSQERPVFEDIDINAPYFVQFNYHIKNEEIKYHSGRGRNLCVEDLDALRLAAEKYVKYFLKGKVAESTEDRLIYWTDNDSTIVVRLYHFPEQILDGERNQVSIPGAGKSCIPEDELIGLTTKHACLKNAIERAKVYSASLGTGFYSPCYDKFTFRDHGYSKAEYRTGPIRIQEDPATLAEIMTAFETYARLDNERTVVLTKDNGVAALVGDIIYLILFNFPDQKKNEIPAIKKRGRKKKVECIAKDTPAPTTNPLIIKSVEMTKALSIAQGTDVNSPFFIQCLFSVIGEGELLPKGRPFIKDINGEDELAKLRRNHLKYAKTMKANDPVSTDDYTAYFWNEGKNISVFYYNTKGMEAAA